MSKQTATQVTIMIIKAARAAGKMDIVDVEALLAEINIGKQMATITADEVASLIEQRYPTVKTIEVEPEVVDEEQAFKEMINNLGAQLPSGRRLLVAFVASFITGACVGYAGSMALAWLLAGALLLGAGAFLTFLITVLVWVLTLIAAYFAGKKVGAYIITGTVDEHFASVKRGIGNAWDWVTSPFSSDEATA